MDDIDLSLGFPVYIIVQGACPAVAQVTDTPDGPLYGIPLFSEEALAQAFIDRVLPGTAAEAYAFEKPSLLEFLQHAPAECAYVAVDPEGALAAGECATVQELIESLCPPEE